MSQFHGYVQIDNEGAYNALEINPYIDLGYNMAISNHFSMLYDLGWVMSKKRSDETISRNCYFLNTHLALHTSGFTKLGLFLGGGLFLTSITGQGGSVPLNNGANTTNYPLPFNTSLGSNLTFNYGLFLRIGIVSFEAMITTYNIHDAVKKQNQYSATLKLHIPMGGDNDDNVEIRQSRPSQPEYDYDQSDSFF